jgi:hypothetical protein
VCCVCSSSDAPGCLTVAQSHNDLLQVDSSALNSCFRRIAVEAEDIANRVNRSLDLYEQVEAVSPGQQILELGVLLADVRHGRARALELTRSVPSPNMVSPDLQDQVIKVSQALFAFIETCRIRETIIDGMANKLSRETAA